MDSAKIKENLTKILKNKNTLTILIVFAGIIGLYVVYNWRVNQATSLVQIPYAKKEINSKFTNLFIKLILIFLLLAKIYVSIIKASNSSTTF